MSQSGQLSPTQPTPPAPELSGAVVQYVQTQTNSLVSHTASFPGADQRLPVNTDGAEYFTLTITPQNASNTLVFKASLNLLAGDNVVGSASIGMAIFQDSNPNALFVATYEPSGGSSNPYECDPGYCFTFILPAGTTSATTFSLRIGGYGESNPGTVPIYMNGFSSPPNAPAQLYDGGVYSNFEIYEIGPANPSPPGEMVNFKYAQTSARNFNGNTFFPNLTGTDPGNVVTNTDGDQIFSITITPESATNLLRFQANIYGGTTNGSSSSPLGIALFQDSTVNALYAVASSGGNWENSEQPCLATMDFIMVAGTTSSTTFNLRAGAVGLSGASIWQLNSICLNSGGNISLPIYANTISTFTITEISQ